MSKNSTSTYVSWHYLSVYPYISRRSRNFGHVKRAVIHGDVRFDQNPVLEVVCSLPGEFQVFFERFDDTGEVAERQKAINDDPTNRI